MQIHCNNVIGTGNGQLIRHQLSRDWRSAFVLLVLARIWKVRNQRRHTLCRGDFTRVDHNEQLHEMIVNVLAASGLNVEQMVKRFGS